MILCGGVGSRLWPVSRDLFPKPFIRLDDGESFLQKTFLRGASFPNVSEVLTITNRELFFETEDEYRDINHFKEKNVKTSFILEPFGRNTAPAIAAASLHLAKHYDEETVMLILPADHLISDQAAFSDAVKKACELARDGRLVTFGIQPTAPETGYGYIESNGYEVVRFVEKPSSDVAQEYLATGKYLWNSGMFCFTVGTMLREMNEHCPAILETTKHCMKQASIVTGEVSTRVELDPKDFDSVPEDSIDYAVMEKTQNAAVVACDIGWSDIGCWCALGDLTSPGKDNNRIQGDAFVHDSKNCTINAEGRVVGVVGVEDLIIIDTPDALLVANKHRAQDVKHVYAGLKAQGNEVHKLHRTVHRPWGTYTVLEEGENFKIKRIEVKPGASLSLQMHKHRSEHWVVVNGTARVINGENELTLNINESTYIPAGHKHRLENMGTEPLALIEVQTGDYLGEDDIVRFQDNYGRSEKR